MIFGCESGATYLREQSVGAPRDLVAFGGIGKRKLQRAELIEADRLREARVEVGAAAPAMCGITPSNTFRLFSSH